MKKTIALAAVLLGLSAREASACPPRCTEPEGPVRPREEEEWSARVCESLALGVLEEAIGVRYTELDLREAITWFFRIRRVAAAYRARAAIAPDR